MPRHFMQGVDIYFCSYRLRDFAKLYDVIKNERNKCVNLIQTSTQKAAEMREKIKILQNEIEILRTAVTQKDRYYESYYEPRCEKTGLRGFRPGPTQTGLYNNRRWLEA